MNGTGDSRRPGVYALSGKDDLRVFEEASGIKYEPESGTVTIQMAVYEANEDAKMELRFRPTAWLKLDEGMLLGIGQAPRKRNERSTGYPYVVRGKDQFAFRNMGKSKQVGDVITFEGKLGVHATDYPGWPAEQTLVLLRLGPGVIFVDSHPDNPMEVVNAADLSLAQR